jgi:predicted NAD-dependent protein-ADP-ribosyltransferase YbiA (DUF1768 family)
MYRKWVQFDAANEDLGRRIMCEKSPSEIKRLGRSVRHFDYEVWKAVSYDVMVDGLRLEFSAPGTPRPLHPVTSRYLPLLTVTYRYYPYLPLLPVTYRY